MATFRGIKTALQPDLTALLPCGTALQPGFTAGVAFLATYACIGAAYLRFAAFQPSFTARLPCGAAV